mgnify:CR=1 FL=1
MKKILLMIIIMGLLFGATYAEPISDKISNKINNVSNTVTNFVVSEKEKTIKYQREQWVNTKTQFIKLINFISGVN